MEAHTKKAFLIAIAVLVGLVGVMFLLRPLGLSPSALLGSKQQTSNGIVFPLDVSGPIKLSADGQWIATLESRNHQASHDTVLSIGRVDSERDQVPEITRPLDYAWIDGSSGPELLAICQDSELRQKLVRVTTAGEVSTVRQLDAGGVYVGLSLCDVDSNRIAFQWVSSGTGKTKLVLLDTGGPESVRTGVEISAKPGTLAWLGPTQLTAADSRGGSADCDTRARPIAGRFG